MGVQKSIQKDMCSLSELNDDYSLGEVAFTFKEKLSAEEQKSLF